MAATDLSTGFRSVYETSHQWLDGTVAGLTSAQAAWIPEGTALPAGAHLAHIITSEDFLINAGVRGGSPLFQSTFAGRTGISEPPVHGNWTDWARRVEVDLVAVREYGRAVYAEVDAYLSGLTAEELAREVDLSAMGFGLGVMAVGALLPNLLTNIGAHTGEIACIKGIQGTQGYPF